ncbi:hypothetical protein PLICRDRAFT_131242 [Plicaturopsis crispa FD-325 SS-3]|nr:hypothetical protein PLICRDRAFT_131242 [Plicaturopsis crispa FD-325 SS-3]
MVFDRSTVTHLKPWLVRALEPICDAEPGALAEYILALLTHDTPESDMRREFVEQLEEFLEKETNAFIDTLFTVLRTKSYLPYAAATEPTPTEPQTMDTGIPIPLDAFMAPAATSTSPNRGQKRNLDNDERDGRPPAKGPRLSNDGNFSRYQNGRGGMGQWGSGGRGRGMNGHGEGPSHLGMGVDMNGMGMNGRSQAYAPPDPKRGICRDYHNNGYCARGAFCKYSHGEDAVIPGQMFPMNGAQMQGPYMPMFPNGGGGMAYGMGAYNPADARMDMRPQTRAPIIPRKDGARPHASGELPVIQDLTPALPPGEMPPPPQNGYREQGNGGMGGRPIPQQQQQQRPMNMPMDIDMGGPMHQLPSQQGGFNGRPRGGGGAGRGRGTFGGEVHNFRPERRNDKTLVVEKIPDDKLSLDAVNTWFKRFGTVTNVAIDASSAKALVSFEDHDAAHAAWKSEDAVFNNRFVKLFWHRPMEGHGQAGSRMLAASAPLVKNISAKSQPPAPAPSSSSSNGNGSSASTITPATPRKTSTTPSAAATALAAKQKLLEQQIAEQKSLMGQLGSASAEEKKTIMARLRKLGEEMTPGVATATPGASPSPGPATMKRKTSTAGTDDRERKERERLDKELEIHSATLDGEGESTEDLKAKLARLKAEAASLGLSEAGADPSYGFGAPTYSRPYRGRGRVSRSFHRGAARGGMPARASMKLDNRPKKLLVKGVSDTGLQAVRDWYETTGQVDAVDTTENGDVLVSFRSRSAAEQGLAKGSNISTIGPVQVSWYADNPSASTTPVPKTTPHTPVNDAPDVHIPEQIHEHSPVHMEEEVAASGWGGDGDGEDGMGML